ncbi:MAG TPA: ubiquinol-cytochrome c reductase iron-sulfur subunit [Bryobacteraceae bacterium]|nr:ubiquinol-cytochrome c reductase iron-sulfur subunit [Bryobacteraceae bacterium]
MDDEHQSQEPAVELSPTRRSFYIKFIYGVMSAIGAALAVPAGIYLLFPPKAHKENEWVDAADLSRLPTGTPEEISFQRTRVDGWKVSSEKATAWVVKTADNQVTAFAPQCTHLGCAYHWDEPTHNFVCPCHTSAFSIDGKVLAGPAPRPLDRYEVKIDGNKLQIGPLERHA